MSSQQPSRTISLRPELSLIASLAHQNTYQNLLPPELYEPESVARSVKIGEGITFTVTKKKVFHPPQLTQFISQKGNITVRSTTGNLRYRCPPMVVYKIPEVEFAADGHAAPGERNERNLASVLLEFFVLLHEPIWKHPFLPKLLGFAWGHNRYSVNQRIPIPILTYADHGSLASFQKDHLLNVEEKRLICWQVGIALTFLHECGISHGDVKSENVLLHYAAAGSGYIAKLTDFGLSHLSFQGSFNFMPPGTRLWAAPEVRSGESIIALDKADTYSFGLMVWRTYCDGLDPLCPLFTDPAPSLPRTIEEAQRLSSQLHRLEESRLQQLESQDQVVSRAKSLNWNVILRIRKAFLHHDLDSSRIRLLPELLSQALPETALYATSQFIQSSCFGWLVSVFENSLCISPQERSLANALVHLAEGQNYQCPTVEPKKLSFDTNRTFRQAATNGHPISWIAMRRLQPQVSDFIFRHRMERASRDDVNVTPFTGLHLGNTACLISGMGSDMHHSINAGLDELAVAARRGNKEAGGIIYRIYNAFERNVPDDIDYVRKVHEAAVYGSVAAYEDLKVVGGELAQSVRTSLRQQTCGVGASFFWNNKCLNGWRFSDRNQLGWIEDLLQSTTEQSDSIIVNLHGDNLLHAAASLDLDYLIPTLLDQYRFQIDKRNQEGETALLCAMRSGSYWIADQLLERGANPCVMSNRGETPMHWLISITEYGQKPMLEKLIAKGGLMTITCWAQICDYAAVEIPSFHHYAERLSRGTPLHWAICRKKPFLIRILLEKGLNAHSKGPYSDYYTPLEQAAYLHEVDLLRLLIEKTAPHPRRAGIATSDRGYLHSHPPGQPPSDGATILYGLPEMVKAAIDGSDRYSLLIRHGDRYKSQMRRTFNLLGKEMEHVSFASGVDHEGRTPLYYAAVGGFDEAVEHIIHYMNGTADINSPYGTSQMTPICQAIRRNHRGLFHKLLEHGARLDVKVDNPAITGNLDWGLLHVAASSIVGGDLAIAKYLIDHGVPIEDYRTADEPSESPLAVAIEDNQFELANILRTSGAQVNARSMFISRPRVKLRLPTTILGRIIAANMRHSAQKLRYLLYPQSSNSNLEQPSFVVEPNNGYTALHWSLLFDEHVENLEEELDTDVRNEIFGLLREKYDDYEQLNARTLDGERTALHIATARGNLKAVEMLLEYDADTSLTDGRGKTALENATDRLEELEQQRGTTKEVDDAREIIKKLIEISDKQEE